MKNNARDTFQNQKNPPLPKKERTDAKGNSFVRIIAKQGGASIIICDHITENAATVLISKLSESIEKLGGKQTVQFKAIR